VERILYTRIYWGSSRNSVYVPDVNRSVRSLQRLAISGENISEEWDFNRATHVYFSSRVEHSMSRKATPDGNMVSDEELTELLADAEGTTPEVVEQGASQIDISPPEEATVVDVEGGE